MGKKGEGVEDEKQAIDLKSEGSTCSIYYVSLASKKAQNKIKQ